MKRFIFVAGEGESVADIGEMIQSTGAELAAVSIAEYLDASFSLQAGDLLLIGPCGNRLDAVLDRIKATRQPFCWYDSDRSARLTPALKRIVCGTLPIVLSEKQWQRVQARIERVQSRLAVATMNTSSVTKARTTKMPRPVLRLAGSSQAMANIRALIEQVAPTDATVLIHGETGTGKEVVAKNIHAGSARAQKSFVAVNCGAIPSDLLESELFGHEKGAFTGALTTRQGRFEMAEGGTLFLDEIGDMPLMMQVKLLRVLQERCFERVGSNQSRGCDVRVITATHQDLEARIRGGAFRQDLYYRLNVFPLDIPPLREHAEDIPELIEELSQRMAAASGATVRFAADAMRELVAHDWPGNVRELGNVLERLAIMFPDVTLTESDLPANIRRPHIGAAEAGAPGESPLPESGLDLRARVARMERDLIEQALHRAQGDLHVAARLLNLEATELGKKIDSHGITA